MQVDNKLYACGGSDGFTDLISAEYLDTVAMKWRRLPDMKTSRSSAGEKETVIDCNDDNYVEDLMRH